MWGFSIRIYTNFLIRSKTCDWSASIYTCTCKTLQPEYLAYVAYLSSGFNIHDMRSTEWLLYALQKSENKTNTGLLNYLNFSACLFRVCIILSIWISRFGNEFVKMYSSIYGIHWKRTMTAMHLHVYKTCRYRYICLPSSIHVHLFKKPFWYKYQN